MDASRFWSGRALGWMAARRIPLGYLASAFFLLFARPAPERLLPGGAAALLGAALRTWSSGYIHKMKEVSRGGPYRWIRHPLYAGSFLMAGGAVYFGGGAAWLVGYVLVFLVFYGRVMRDEEAALEERFGAGYRDYARRVPRVIPRLAARIPAAPGAFDWRLALGKHREWEAWVGLAGVFALLSARALVRGALGW